MTINPILLGTQQVNIPNQFTSQGAYGDYLNQQRPRSKKQAPAPEQVFGPYYGTQSGLEVTNPGESAQSVQARQQAASTSGTTPPGTSTTQTTPTTAGSSSTATGKTVVNTFTNAQGQQVAVFSDGSTTVIGAAQDKIGERKSAFDLLRQEFERYGLGDLVGDTLTLAQEGVSPAEFSLRLRQTPTYKERFSANDARIKAGLTALNEAQYVALEDQYQNIMRQYGLPQSFYSTGKAGRQPELEKFLAGDVSPAELEDRIQIAVNRIQNAPTETMTALEKFYPEITKANLLAYTLDPQKALPEIKRQVQAAEIGGAALGAGLAAEKQTALDLAKMGVTGAQAQQGYQSIAGGLERGSQLAQIYGQEPYTQTTAEQEVFGMPGAASARRKRQQISGLEAATFGGTAQAGRGGALARDRAGGF